MSELKPCPFCGSIDVEVVHCDEVCSVCCDNCEAGYWTGAPGDAESVWNRRVSPWRSLKDDPPGDDNRLILLRGRPERRGAEQSGIVPDIPGWDGVVHEFARASWSLTSRLTEWMEIPK